MSWLYTGYLLGFAVAGLACLIGGYGVRTLAHPDVRRGLAGLLLLTGVWSLLTTGQLLVSSESAIRLVYIASLGVGISTVFAWLYFASAYSGRQYHRTRTVRLLGAGILASILAVKLTNPIHGMYFDVQMATEPFPHGELVHFAPHWFVTGFSYTAAGIGFWFLYEAFAEANSQPTLFYLLVGATALPVVPYVVAPHVDSLLQVNYEPLGVAVFALGVLFFARSEFTQLSSPDRSYIADSISEGAIIIDDDGRIINHNDSVATIFDTLSEQRPTIEAVNETLATLEPGETAIFTREVDGRERTFEAHRTTLEDAPMATAAITVTDVSTIAHIDEVTQLYREINDVLVAGGDLEQLMATVPEKLTEIETYPFAWFYAIGDDDGYVGGEPTGYVDAQLSDGGQSEPVLLAARTGQRQHTVVADSDDPWAVAAADREITECLAVPMKLQGDKRYVLGVYTTAPDGFNASEITLFTELGEAIPHALSAIRAHEEATEFQEAITHAGYAIYITDTDGTIRHVNPAFEEVTGYPPEEAIGQTPGIFSSGEMGEEYYDRLWATISAGDVFEEEIVNKRRGGDRYLARQTIAPVTDDTGDPVAFVAVQIDITDRHVREQRLAVLNRILRHNLRNEMNIVSGSAKLVEDALESFPDDSEQSTRAIERIADIQELANSIVTRAEKAREIEKLLEQTHASREPVPVEAVLESVRDRLRETSLEWSIDVAEAVDGRLVDHELIRIVDELIENAIEHTDSSNPVVEVTVEDTEDGEVSIIVADNGSGLSEQELAILDEEVETQLTHGSGLGLWMVTWLLTYCGGSITATTDDRGTTLEILVPERQARERVKPPSM